MEEQKVTSLQILMHCAPHSNQIWLQMSIQPFLLWLVYISIRIPAYPSTDSSITGERQIGKNFESSGHDTIVTVSQNISEGTYQVHKKP